MQRCSGQDGTLDRQLPPEDPLGALCTCRVGLTNRWPGVEGGGNSAGRVSHPYSWTRRLSLGRSCSHKPGSAALTLLTGVKKHRGHAVQDKTLAGKTA